MSRSTWMCGSDEPRINLSQVDLLPRQVGDAANIHVNPDHQRQQYDAKKRQQDCGITHDWEGRHSVSADPNPII
jgi:hypothetical protein